MSKLSEESRAKLKSKAERMVRGDPKTPVDASGYTPEGMLDGDVQTGMRPVSRRQYRNGGGVAGSEVSHAGRKARKSGGSANEYINRDAKSANDERAGTKHVGALKSGGRAKRDMGGMALPQAFTPVNRASGGRAHGDDCKCAKCSGGRVGRDAGGGVMDGVRVGNPTTKKPLSSRAAQAVAGSAMRMAMKRGVDPYNSHPTQAKAYDTLYKLNGGRPSRASGGPINDGTRPAGGREPRKSGGRTNKKGTNVNIIITQPGGANAAAPPMPMPPPGPPGGPPLGLRQGVPPPAAGMPPPGGPPAGAPAPSPMMRQRGGRTGYPLDAGSGSGLGRLEKTARANP